MALIWTRTWLMLACLLLNEFYGSVECNHRKNDNKGMKESIVDVVPRATMNYDDSPQQIKQEDKPENDAFTFTLTPSVLNELITILRKSAERQNHTADQVELTGEVERNFPIYGTDEGEKTPTKVDHRLHKRSVATSEEQKDLITLDATQEDYTVKDGLSENTTPITNLAPSSDKDENGSEKSMDKGTGPITRIDSSYSEIKSPADTTETSFTSPMDSSKLNLNEKLLDGSSKLASASSPTSNEARVGNPNINSTKDVDENYAKERKDDLGTGSTRMVSKEGSGDYGCEKTKTQSREPELQNDQITAPSEVVLRTAFPDRPQNLHVNSTVATPGSGKPLRNLIRPISNPSLHFQSVHHSAFPPNIHYAVPRQPSMEMSYSNSPLSDGGISTTVQFYPKTYSNGIFLSRAKGSPTSIPTIPRQPAVEMSFSNSHPSVKGVSTSNQHFPKASLNGNSWTRIAGSPTFVSPGAVTYSQYHPHTCSGEHNFPNINPQLLPYNGSPQTPHSVPPGASHPPRIRPNLPSAGEISLSLNSPTRISYTQINPQMYTRAPFYPSYIRPNLPSAGEISPSLNSPNRIPYTQIPLQMYPRTPQVSDFGVNSRLPQLPQNGIPVERNPLSNYPYQSKYLPYVSSNVQANFKRTLPQHGDPLYISFTPSVGQAQNVNPYQPYTRSQQPIHDSMRPNVPSNVREDFKGNSRLVLQPHRNTPDPSIAPLFDGDAQNIKPQQPYQQINPSHVDAALNDNSQFSPQPYHDNPNTESDPLSAGNAQNIPSHQTYQNLPSPDVSSNDIPRIQRTPSFDENPQNTNAYQSDESPNISINVEPINNDKSPKLPQPQRDAPSTQFAPSLTENDKNKNSPNKTGGVRPNMSSSIEVDPKMNSQLLPQPHRDVHGTLISPIIDESPQNVVSHQQNPGGVRPDVSSNFETLVDANSQLLTQPDRDIPGTQFTPSIDASPQNIPSFQPYTSNVVPDMLRHIDTNFNSKPQFMSQPNGDILNAQYTPSFDSSPQNIPSLQSYPGNAVPDTFLNINTDISSNSHLTTQPSNDVPDAGLAPSLDASSKNIPSLQLSPERTFPEISTHNNTTFNDNSQLMPQPHNYVSDTVAQLFDTNPQNIPSQHPYSEYKGNLQPVAQPNNDIPETPVASLFNTNAENIESNQSNQNSNTPYISSNGETKLNDRSPFRPQSQHYHENDKTPDISSSVGTKFKGNPQIMPQQYRKLPNSRLPPSFDENQQNINVPHSHKNGNTPDIPSSTDTGFNGIPQTLPQSRREIPNTQLTPSLDGSPKNVNYRPSHQIEHSPDFKSDPQRVRHPHRETPNIQLSPSLDENSQYVNYHPAYQNGEDPDTSSNIETKFKDTPQLLHQPYGEIPGYIVSPSFDQNTQNFNHQQSYQNSNSPDGPSKPENPAKDNLPFMPQLHHDIPNTQLAPSYDQYHETMNPHQSNQDTDLRGISPLLNSPTSIPFIQIPLEIHTKTPQESDLGAHLQLLKQQQKDISVERNPPTNYPHQSNYIPYMPSRAQADFEESSPQRNNPPYTPRTPSAGQVLNVNPYQSHTNPQQTNQDNMGPDVPSNVGRDFKDNPQLLLQPHRNPPDTQVVLQFDRDAQNLKPQQPYQQIIPSHVDPALNDNPQFTPQPDHSNNNIPFAPQSSGDPQNIPYQQTYQNIPRPGISSKDIPRAQSTLSSDENPKHINVYQNDETSNNSTNVEPYDNGKSRKLPQQLRDTSGTQFAPAFTQNDQNRGFPKFNPGGGKPGISSSIEADPKGNWQLPPQPHRGVPGSQISPIIDESPQNFVFHERNPGSVRPDVSSNSETAIDPNSQPPTQPGLDIPGAQFTPLLDENLQTIPSLQPYPANAVPDMSPLIDTTFSGKPPFMSPPNSDDLSIQFTPSFDASPQNIPLLQSYPENAVPDTSSNIDTNTNSNSQLITQANNDVFNARQQRIPFLQSYPANAVPEKYLHVDTHINSNPQLMTQTNGHIPDVPFAPSFDATRQNIPSLQSYPANVQNQTKFKDNPKIMPQLYRDIPNNQLPASIDEDQLNIKDPHSQENGSTPDTSSNTDTEFNRSPQTLPQSNREITKSQLTPSLAVTYPSFDEHPRNTNYRPSHQIEHGPDFKGNPQVVQHPLRGTPKIQLAPASDENPQHVKYPSLQNGQAKIMPQQNREIPNNTLPTSIDENQQNINVPHSPEIGKTPNISTNTDTEFKGSPQTLPQSHRDIPNKQFTPSFGKSPQNVNYRPSDQTEPGPDFKGNPQIVQHPLRETPNIQFSPSSDENPQHVKYPSYQNGQAKIMPQPNREIPNNPLPPSIDENQQNINVPHSPEIGNKPDISPNTDTEFKGSPQTLPQSHREIPNKQFTPSFNESPRNVNYRPSDQIEPGPDFKGNPQIVQHPLRETPNTQLSPSSDENPQHVKYPSYQNGQAKIMPQPNREIPNNPLPSSIDENQQKINVPHSPEIGNKPDISPNTDIEFKGSPQTLPQSHREIPNKQFTPSFDESPRNVNYRPSDQIEPGPDFKGNPQIEQHPLQETPNTQLSPTSDENPQYVTYHPSYQNGHAKIMPQQNREIPNNPLPQPIDENQQNINVPHSPEIGNAPHISINTGTEFRGSPQTLPQSHREIPNKQFTPSFDESPRNVSYRPSDQIEPGPDFKGNPQIVQHPLRETPNIQFTPSFDENPQYVNYHPSYQIGQAKIIPQQNREIPGNPLPQPIDENQQNINVPHSPEIGKTPDISPNTETEFKGRPQTLPQSHLEIPNKQFTSSFDESPRNLSYRPSDQIEHGPDFKGNPQIVQHPLRETPNIQFTPSFDENPQYVNYHPSYQSGQAKIIPQQNREIPGNPLPPSFDENQQIINVPHSKENNPTPDIPSSTDTEFNRSPQALPQSHREIPNTQFTPSFDEIPRNINYHPSQQIEHGPDFKSDPQIVQHPLRETPNIQLSPSSDENPQNVNYRPSYKNGQAKITPQQNREIPNNTLPPLIGENQQSVNVPHSPEIGNTPSISPNSDTEFKGSPQTLPQSHREIPNKQLAQSFDENPLNVNFRPSDQIEPGPDFKGYPQIVQHPLRKTPNIQLTPSSDENQQYVNYHPSYLNGEAKIMPQQNREIPNNQLPPSFDGNQQIINVPHSEENSPTPDIPSSTDTEFNRSPQTLPQSHREIPNAKFTPSFDESPRNINYHPSHQIEHGPDFKDNPQIVQHPYGEIPNIQLSPSSDENPQHVNYLPSYQNGQDPDKSSKIETKFKDSPQLLQQPYSEIPGNIFSPSLDHNKPNLNHQNSTSPDVSLKPETPAKDNSQFMPKLHREIAGIQHAPSFDQYQENMNPHQPNQDTSLPGLPLNYDPSFKDTPQSLPQPHSGSQLAPSYAENSQNTPHQQSFPRNIQPDSTLNVETDPKGRSQLLPQLRPDNISNQNYFNNGSQSVPQPHPDFSPTFDKHEQQIHEPRPKTSNRPDVFKSIDSHFKDNPQLSPQPYTETSTLDENPRNTPSHQPHPESGHPETSSDIEADLNGLPQLLIEPHRAIPDTQSAPSFDEGPLNEPSHERYQGPNGVHRNPQPNIKNSKGKSIFAKEPLPDSKVGSLDKTTNEMAYPMFAIIPLFGMYPAFPMVPLWVMQNSYLPNIKESVVSGKGPLSPKNGLIPSLLPLPCPSDSSNHKSNVDTKLVVPSYQYQSLMPYLPIPSIYPVQTPYEITGMYARFPRRTLSNK